jgi:hypothetical protein
MKLQTSFTALMDVAQCLVPVLVQNESERKNATANQLLQKNATGANHWHLIFKEISKNCLNLRLNLFRRDSLLRPDAGL